MTDTWNRSALPAYATPTPGYIGVCTSGGSSCGWDTDCAGGQTCNAGMCSGGSPCYADSQCATGQSCGNGTCSISGTSCRLNSQCLAGERCNKYVDISFKGANTWFIDYGADGYYRRAFPAAPPPVERWQYAYSGYGYSSAVPAPADYDGDGFTDLSVKDSSSGYWYIDWSSNGFGGWDVVRSGYGGALALPVPGDYDGDGKADIAIKDSTGFWGIDYASDGFGSWNVQVSAVYGWNYGDSNSIPVPADYDGDGKTDIAIKNNTTGTWSIDYMADGFGRAFSFGTRLQYNVSVSGYGTATPVPADYNNDGKVDIGQKDFQGTWMVDLAPTFGAWDQPFRPGYGPTSIAVPGDYDHDGMTDLSVVDPATGDWYVDYASNGLGGWDNWPGTSQWHMPNATRALVDQTRPHIISTAVYDENNNPTTTLLVGERYTVDVVVEPGTSGPESASVEANPALLASPSLIIHDGSTFAAIKLEPCGDLNHPPCGGTPECDSVSKTCKPHRRFAIECSQPGTFVLGYLLRKRPIYFPDSSPVNPDYGIKIVCTSSYTGLYGRVTERIGSTQTTSAGQPAFYRRGPAIQGAQIRVVETGDTATSDVTGFWRLPNVSGGPYTIQITAPSRSDTIAVNVNVPASGFELNTPLEEAFTPLRNTGAVYRTYIDYSRNRLVLHTIAISSIVERSNTPRATGESIVGLLQRRTHGGPSTRPDSVSRAWVTELP